MGPFGMSSGMTAAVMIVLLIVVLVITTSVVTAIERVKIAKHTGRDPRTTEIDQ